MWGLRWLSCEKYFMNASACCLFVGTPSVEVMPSCVCMVLQFESVMLLIVL